MKASIPDVDWQRNRQTLLLVVQKNCHFCTESGPFYQRLLRDTAGRSDLRVVAILPQKVDEGRQYLSSLGLSIDDVRQATPASLGTSGTPTLILVNSAGVITDFWVGKLAPDKEAEVLGRLKS